MRQRNVAIVVLFFFPFSVW